MLGVHTNRVSLTNQFANDFSGGLGAVVWHCNPVQKTAVTSSGKTVTPIVNPDDHLLCWNLDTEPLSPFNVVVTNQFGTAALTTASGSTEPTTLCAPTWKSEGSTSCSGCVTLPQTQIQPPGLDHYVCYPASYTTTTSGGSSSVVEPFGNLPTKLKLQDEFMPKAVKATIGPPNYLCLRTKKVTNGVIPSALINPTVHLVCFPVTAPVTPPPNGVSDQNQFGMGVVVIHENAELCLPSTKQVITAVGTTVTVSPSGGLVTIEAVNASYGIGLMGAVFSVDADGNQMTCTTDTTGTCSVSTGSAETVTVMETGAPEGYSSAMPATETSGEPAGDVVFLDTAS